MRTDRLRIAAALITPLLCCGVCQPTLLGGSPQEDAIRMPPGFSISVFASDLPSVRAMALDPDGTVYAGSKSEGAVYAMPDADHDGAADTVYTLLRGLNMPVGVAWHKGDLYVSSVDRILRLRGISEALRDPPEPEVYFSGLPSEKHHGWKFIAFGPDDRLYIPVGAPCNNCLSEDPLFASIARLTVDGDSLEIVAHGVRNSVGFDWDPRDGTLWFTENGRDWMGDDLPNCELNHLTRIGQHFGYPFCHQGDTLDDEFGAGKNCADYVPPVAKLGPHVAPLGMCFYTGDLFPEKYRGAIFIAEHGSWNRTKPLGYRIKVVYPTNTGQVEQEVFAEGWLSGGSAWGRPVDVMQLQDGSLLVSDDAADRIWRITWHAP